MRRLLGPRQPWPGFQVEYAMQFKSRQGFRRTRGVISDWMTANPSLTGKGRVADHPAEISIGWDRPSRVPWALLLQAKIIMTFPLACHGFIYRIAPGTSL